MWPVAPKTYSLWRKLLHRFQERMEYPQSMRLASAGCVRKADRNSWEALDSDGGMLRQERDSGWRCRGPSQGEWKAELETRDRALKAVPGRGMWGTAAANRSVCSAEGGQGSKGLL